MTETYIVNRNNGDDIIVRIQGEAVEMLSDSGQMLPVDYPASDMRLCVWNAGANAGVHAKRR